MIRNVLLCFVFMGSLLFGFAQEMKINGTVVDTNIFQPIYGAKAYVINLEDSVITDYQNTNKQGDFEFNLPLSNYRLFISYPNYADKEFLFLGTKENPTFELGDIHLDDDVSNLEEVAIYANRSPIYYRGDTLVYVADSFATRENAVVEDLLKQLPGIVVEMDGSISSQGNRISKVYVDGDEFFGSDPTIATKNLAAKSIDRVQVFEIESEDGSIDDDKIQVLDLRLKADAKTGWFAKANGASDFQDFHEGQLLFNRFTNKNKIFAFGLGSNTLNSSLSKGDAALAGVKGSALGSSSNSGYPETYRTGVFFSQKVSEKFKFDGNYSFSDNKLKSLSERSTQYLLSDTTYSSDDESMKNTSQKTHDLDLNFIIDIDETQKLKIVPRFSFTASENVNNKTTVFSEENGENIRRAANANESTSDAINASLRIQYDKDFAKAKRKLKLKNYIAYSENKGISQLNYFDYFYFSDLTDNEILQQKENETVNFSNTFTTSYTEPLSDKWRLNFDYELFNNTNDQQKFSYDWDGAGFTLLDSLTSNVFTTSRFQNKLGVSASLNTVKHNFTFGVRERSLLVQNENEFSGDFIHQNELSTLPFLTYRYRISQNSNFTSRVTTNSSLPSISYLSPSRDNSNPNAVLEGNETLRSNYNINGRVNYSLFKRVSEIAFNAQLSARYTFNDFAKSLTYDSLGRSVSVYENINTFNNTTVRTSLSMPIFKKTLRINPSFTYSNSNQNNIVDGVNNLTNTHSFTPELRLTVFTSYLEFNSNLRLTEQKGLNSINSKLNINNSIWNLNNDLTLRLPYKFNVIISGNYYNYSNLSQNFNSEFFILNASFNKDFGKYNEWQVGIEGYDLLNQNTQISRTITANTIVDSRNDIITNYFLVRVSYMLNSTFRKKDKDEGE